MLRGDFKTKLDLQWRLSAPMSKLTLVRPKLTPLNSLKGGK